MRESDVHGLYPGTTQANEARIPPRSPPSFAISEPLKGSEIAHGSPKEPVKSVAVSRVHAMHMNGASPHAH